MRYSLRSPGDPCPILALLNRRRGVNITPSSYRLVLVVAQVSISLITVKRTLFHSAADQINAAYRDCDQAVDDYKNDRVTRAAAMRIINRTLSAAGLDNPTFERVLETYLVRLDKKDRAEKRAQDLNDAMAITVITTVAVGLAEITAEAIDAVLFH